MASHTPSASPTVAPSATAPSASAASRAAANRPAYILRGHASPVHALAFCRRNARLVSGDADGFVAVWSVAIKRPVAVWRAHSHSVLAIQAWGDDRIISQGRDGKLLVWSWSAADEATPGWSVVLPAEGIDQHRRQPWLLHSLDISTMNFCAFACCPLEAAPDEERQQDADALIVAVAGAKDSEIELYRLPDQQLKGLVTTPRDATGKPAGMAMALDVFYDATRRLTVLVAYENGQTCVFKRSATVSSSSEEEAASSTATEQTPKAAWRQVYLSKSHEEPILSLARAPDSLWYFTSAADGTVAKHSLVGDEKTSKTIQASEVGLQGLCVRSDGRFFAVAGWDARGRVYAADTMQQTAVLQWHKESCYSTAFAAVNAVEAEAHSGSAGIAQLNNTVARAREDRARNTHWLALGSKDGKISLWDIH